MPRPRKSLPQLPDSPGAALAHVLARNVLAARDKQGLAQEALATKAGISRRTLQRVEGPEGVADLNSLAQLADALGLPAAHLLR